MFVHKRLYHFLLLKKCKQKFDRVHIFAILMLSLSIFITAYISSTLNILQDNCLVINNLFCQDLGILIASKVIDILDWSNNQQLISFIDNIYLATSSIKYIVLYTSDSTLFFSVPIYDHQIQNLLQVHQSILKLESYDVLFNTPLVKYSTLLNENITDIVIPLIRDGYNIGSLEIGIRSSPFFYMPLSYINFISLILFICIWLISFLWIFFNKSILNVVLNNIIQGINNIALGNLDYRMDVTMNYQMNDLVFNFNHMIAKLQHLEKYNLYRLTLEQSKLELIASSIEDGIVLLDSELRILLTNNKANQVFHSSTKDFIGLSISDYFPLHITKVLLPILNNLVKYNCFESITNQFEEVYVHVNYETKIAFHFILKVIIDKTNSPLIGILIVIKDISKEVNLTENKDYFISNVSHELRTPLCNISSLLETLLDYNESFYEYQKIKFLKIANHETKRLSKLVNDILDLSKLDANSNYCLVHTDLCLILQYLMNIFQVMAKQNNIDLILEIDPSIKYTLAHESSLYQVLYNLLSNSLKFTNFRSFIIIRVYSLISIPLDHALLYDLQDKNYNCIHIIRIEIIDEGIGIDKKNQERIFNRFMRIENNTHILQGTGLGLSIVRNILNKYQTNIYVHSLLMVGTSLCFDLIEVS